MENTRPVTNIIDLLECQEIKDLMCVNGFVWTGSAYDRFRALCICAERQPDVRTVLRMQTYLKEVLGCDLPINTSICHQIWKETAERLLLGDEVPCPFLEDEPDSLCLPSVVDLSLPKCFLLNDLRIEANDWAQWKSDAEEILFHVLNEGGTVGVSLGEEYGFEKTSLYNANRAIAEGDWNCSSWISQLMYFLCDFCASHGARAKVVCPSDGAKLFEILQHVSKLTRLPNLYVECSQPKSEELLPVCRLVLSERDKSDAGVPPVLWVNPS